MPENIEESAEVAMEAIEAESREHGGHVPKWILWASLSTMIMALFSAVGGLLAGMTGNEAIIERQEQLSELIFLNRMELASDVLLTRLAVIESTGKRPPQELLDAIEKNTKAVAEYSSEASEDVADSKFALQTHELFAIGTTILAVAITLTGMAVIVRQKRIWYVGLGISASGALVVVYAIVDMASA